MTRNFQISIATHVGRAVLPCAALLLVFLGGCDFNRTWDLGQPFAPLVVLSPELSSDSAQAAFSSAIHQLGGTVQEGAAQVVYLRFDAACDCPGCHSQTVAYTDRFSQDTINFCPLWKKLPTDGMEDNILHELGHVLGQWDHLPCEASMMSPHYNCRSVHKEYSAWDLHWICTGTVGGVTGGICDQAASWPDSK
jgi:hypothetical protein